MIKPSKKAVSRNRMLKALDKQSKQEVCGDRDQWTCQRCGRQHGDWDIQKQAYVIVQWCHVQTREYHILRWEPDNTLVLCKEDHVWFDNHKVQSYEWFSKKWPERWANIQRVLQMPCKTSMAWLRERYNELNRPF